jgi:hypothetical protein
MIAPPDLQDSPSIGSETKGQRRSRKGKLRDLENTVRWGNASGGGQILNVRRFRTSFLASRLKQCQEDNQGGQIQTSSPRQSQSPKPPNALIVGYSIRPEPSISYLAEHINGGVSRAQINLKAPRYRSHGENTSDLQHQSGKLRLE